MKLNRPTILKSLLAIVPALLVALVLQPSSALAVTSVEVNYTTDGNGSVNPDSEKQYSSVSLLVGEEDPYGGSAPYTVDWVDGFLIEGATPLASVVDYEFAYWTANEKVYVPYPNYEDGYWVKCIDAGTAISAGEMANKIYVAGDVTFEAHFKSTKPHTVTYTVDGNGEAFDEDKASESVEDGNSPASVPTPYAINPNKFTFDHWTADKDVTLTDGTTIKEDDSITSDQIAKVKVTSNITFTAHFRQTKVNVSYASIRNGSVSPVSETVSLSEQYSKVAGKVPSPTITPDTGYEFDYWTATQVVYKFVPDNPNDPWETISANSKITTADLSDIYVTRDTNFTAHFKQTEAKVTYTCLGQGGGPLTSDETVKLTKECGDKLAGNIKGSTPSPDSDYAFDYWAVSADVYTYDADTGVWTTIRPDEKITTADLSNIWVTQDTTFTLYFKPVAKITYTTDGNGSVSTSSEQIDRTRGAALGGTFYLAGLASDVSASPNTGYVFDYWTANHDVYTINDANELVKADTELDSTAYYVIQATTFTAHFTRVYTFTYKADPHGSVSPTTEVVRADDTPAGPNISPDAGYAFDHWTADKDVEVADATQAIMLTGSEDDVAPQAGTITIQAGDPITAEQFALIVPTTDATFTANFVRVPPFTVSYTTDGNGSVADESETINEAFDSPLGTEVTANKGFEFDYWTASTDVQIPGEEGGDPITIAQGEKITDEQLKQVLVTDDITFTAHFKQTAVDPDGGDTIKPADGEGGKLTPKTGDTLPGAVVAVALGAGVVVAGATLLRKRCQ